MVRRAFFSFHYQRDAWRASQVRNIGVVEGNPSASDNKWEEVKRGGDVAIRRWIDEQLTWLSCTIVLMGAETASRQWVKYEIEKSWNDGKKDSLAFAFTACSITVGRRRLLAATRSISSHRKTDANCRRP